MKCINFRRCLTTALLAAVTSTSHAQNTVNWTTVGVDSWGDHNNWDTYGPPDIIPEGRFQDIGVISNGGTAQVSGTFNSVSNPGGPGGVVVNSGTLEILSGGTLGLAEPAAGSLVDRSVTISDTLSVLGTGQLVDVGSLNFGVDATYHVGLTDATTTPVQVDGTASLNGSLSIDFSSLADPTGTRTLLAAGSVGGSFSSVDATGLGPAQFLSVESTLSGVLQATVFNVPTLRVDRQTGEAWIVNTHASALPIDGFSVQSTLGAFDTADFAGMPRSGWDPAGTGTANLVAEAYEGPSLGASSDPLPSSTLLQVGGPGFFSTPTAQFFLQETEDVVFEVTDESFGLDPVRGNVEYIGEKVINNNVVLYIDGDGNASMLNETYFPQDVEVYRISSSGSPLQTATWDPLADQTGLDNDTWQASAQSGAEALIEVTEDGSTNFDRFTRFDIGQILQPGYSETGITFEFLMDGDNAFTTGAVVFTDTIPDPDALPASPGDFNGDGLVNAADYTTWRDNLGQPASAINEQGSGALLVVEADYDVWAENYGADYSPGATAVPEPASLGLVLAAALFGVRTHRRSLKA